MTILRPFLLVLIIFIVMTFGWCYTRDLPAPVPAEMAAHADLTPFDNRHMEHVVLHTDSIGDIGIALSLPDPPPGPPNDKMPIIMVLGGLGTGEENIHHITNAGNNIIVGYDWPMSIVPPKDPAFLLHVPEFYRNTVNVPAQIAVAIDWLSLQPWADGNRISILGYSMGALAAPAAQNFTEQSGHIVRWTILAYGGSPLGTIFSADKHLQPDWLRAALAPLIDVVFHPLEPTLHLANLTGHFLILEGKDDGLIPESARAELRNAVPQPKKVVTLEGNHMGVGPDKEELLQQIIATSREWLLQMNAVNPL